VPFLLGYFFFGHAKKKYLGYRDQSRLVEVNPAEGGTFQKKALDSPLQGNDGKVAGMTDELGNDEKVRGKK
jgi:hypothetical protein